MNSGAQCPLCGGAPVGVTFPFGTQWDGRRFEYLRCGRCRSSFVDPLPTAAELARMYDRASYHDEHYAGGAETQPSSFLPKLTGRLPAGGSLLDFGCGAGAFLRLAAEAGYDSVGVELEESARVHARANSGRPVFALEELIAAGRRFDIIHMSDVLEHLPDPAAAMRRLEELLSERGVFFIEGPLEDNAGVVFWASSLFGAAKKALGRNLYGSMPPFHLFRTSARAQRAFFAERLGYRIRTFLMDETGWPYANPGDQWTRPHSAGHFARMAIGRAGVALGKAAALIGAPVGNRFAAVLSPGDAVG